MLLQVVAGSTGMEYFIREQRRVVEPLIAAVYSAKLGCVATCSARRLSTMLFIILITSHTSH
jgi:hypothetical protein